MIAPRPASTSSARPRAWPPLPTAGSDTPEGSGYKSTTSLATDTWTLAVSDLTVTHAINSEKGPNRTLPNTTELVFDNAALLKVEMAHRAMHLAADIRQKIYGRIDQILDPDDWEEDSSLVRPSSFVTFLRSLVADKISRIPALGVSVGGDLLATWWNGSPDRSLFVRYCDADKIWVIASVNGQTVKAETVAGSFRAALARAGISEELIDDAIAENPT